MTPERIVALFLVTICNSCICVVLRELAIVTQRDRCAIEDREISALLLHYYRDLPQVNSVVGVSDNCYIT